MNISAISITANAAVADVKVQQNTLIDSVTLEAGSVIMNSGLNGTSNFDSADQFDGALAVLGGSHSATGNISISAAKATVSSANAMFSGRNHSYINKATVIADNAVQINANSRSFARGDVSLDSTVGWVYCS